MLDLCDHPRSHLLAKWQPTVQYRIVQLHFDKQERTNLKKKAPRMFLNSTSYQNVCGFFFWQCTALKSMSPLSGVTFSSCCNAQPPLLNKRQQNVHRINLHMLSFITINKQTNKRKYLDTLKSVQSSIMKHCVCYIHTVNTS